MPSGTHTSDFDHYLRVLRNDKRVIFAAAHAERTPVFGPGLQPKAETPAAPEADNYQTATVAALPDWLAAGHVYRRVQASAKFSL
jgi:hypothetical protein